MNRLRTSLLVAISSMSLAYAPVSFAEGQNSFNDDRRDIYKTFDSEDQSNQGIPSSPSDLLQTLRSLGSMNDATNPSDAIDEALEFFIQESAENVLVE